MLNDDEEIEILDFDEPESKESKQQNPTNTKEDKKINTRQQVLVAKPRTKKYYEEEQKEKQKKKGLGFEYTIIIIIMLVVVILMIKMLITVDEKHSNKNLEDKNSPSETIKEGTKDEDSQKNTCKITETMNGNINITRTATLKSRNQKLKAVEVEEKQVYQTQDNTYMNKISECSRSTSSNEIEGITTTCGIEDHNNTITILIKYDLEKIDSNIMSNINQQIKLDSNIQEILSYYKGINYTCR